MDKAALLAVIGAMRDGTKEVLAIVPAYRESTESWTAVVRDLKARGLGDPRLLMADGNPAIWAAPRQVWTKATEQRCWNQDEERAGPAFKRGNRRKPGICSGPWYPKAVATLEEDWGRMVKFYEFPEAQWKHVRKTNVVESPFASVRLRTTAAKRFKGVERATALIWKLLTAAEKRIRPESRRSPLAQGRA